MQVPSDTIESSHLRKRARGYDLEDDSEVRKRNRGCQLDAEITQGPPANILERPVAEDLPSKSQRKSETGRARQANPSRLGEMFFIHKPLQLDIPSIRLIELHPSDDDNDIKCSIRHVTLELPPCYDPQIHDPIAGRYTCLSYVWGPADKTRWITVNGKLFEVRMNLWNFLRAASSLRARDKHDPDLWYKALWIDAMCIDQENSLERNHQVQQMGRIYSSAIEVTAWMGDDQRLATLMESVKAESSLGPDEIFHKKQLRSNSDWGSSDWEHLCNNTYWKRAWVVQEVLRARSLFFLASGVSMHVRELRKMLLQAPKSQALEPLNLLDNIAKKSSNAVVSAKLISNIELFRRKECMDIRDRVYSLLSVSCDGSQLPVNYDSSLGELTRSVIRINKDGVCFESVLLVLKAILLEQSLLDVDACLPIIATRGSQMLRYKTTCPRCGEDISMAQHEVSVSDPSRSRYICLHCNHFGLSRPSGVHEISHQGHLCVIWGTIAEGNYCDWHVFWAPLEGGEWQRLLGYKYTLTSENGSLRRLIVSLGLLCEIESLISRHQHQDPMHFLGSKTNHYPACTSSWEVVE
jgi:ribosomal protein S27AE